ncbi:MAG TPA: glycosyltransferase family 2 protein [Baekduia sp.]|uniref:glycosyltransferase family 2 protein n=1 Tax=Baekduia sp. TaxID=2600305 RepID=UPI002D0951D7|nr:glycosyltransferase family 2 protein [Baekduia sp.]HMJ33993.1 glycosyltransferase family 2 protein [Baekduia sp.]
MTAPFPLLVDVVVVSYNSRPTLRDCVAPLAGAPGVRVIVVDNASPDDATDTVADLEATVVHSGRNGGFSFGCNIGAAAGDAPYVLLLNPDARLAPEDLQRLIGALEADPSAAVAGPVIVEDDGSPAPSQRRFPTLPSTLAQALFVHRLLPRLDELIHDPAAYATPGTPDWVSGACLLIRRSVLTELGGMDERFFLYCEDTDICRRVWDAGHRVRFEPAARARHVGGASGDRSGLRPVLAASRVAYARKRRGRLAAALEALAVGLGEAVHALAKLHRPAQRRGHLAALRAVTRPATGAS